MKALAVGGVPEHFNLPWRRLLESGKLAELGIDARWEDFPGGTGAMGAALNEGRLDLAMLLTEGAVAGIANGGSFRILTRFTETPLTWGIHVPASSRFLAVEDLRGARYAISRFGSGSHLMAFAHARQKGWPVGELKFEVVGSLEGAITAFEEGRADIFLWERFMTQPLVEAGRFRRVGEFTAPWPAFVVCASAKALRDKSDAISTALQQVLETAAALAASADTAADTADDLSRRYGLARRDAAQWLKITRWAARVRIEEADIDEVLDVLRAVGLVPPDGDWSMIARV